MGRIRALILLATVVAATLVPPVGRAVGGRYAFAGGTPRQQAVVTRALDASSFDWSRVPAQVTIHVGHVTTSYATPGDIWLDADLLNAGTLAWGVVQHEYAHQVDFFLLTAAARSLLLRDLGAKTWCPDSALRRDPASRAFSSVRFRTVLNRMLARGER